MRTEGETSGRRRKLALVSGAMKGIMVTLIALLALACLAPQPVQAQSTDVYALIDAVNALRAEYGLPPYSVNASLVSAAQSHSEWAASVGYHSHAGPDGSRPRDRAIRAGYGGGATVYVSENIYWSSGNPSIASAVGWWRNSPIHFEGMTSTFYQEIGAGIAFSGGSGYFTLLFGNQSGGAASSSGGVAAGAPESSADSSVTGFVQPVVVSTPGPDGAIVHQVESGQAMALIARYYGIDLYQLLAANGLTEDSIIFPGDQIIIQPPFTPTPSPYPSPAPSITPVGVAAAGIPAAVAEEGALENGEELTPLVPEAASPEPSATRRWLYLGFGGIGLLGFVLIGLGVAQNRRSGDGKAKPWYEWE